MKKLLYILVFLLPLATFAQVDVNAFYGTNVARAYSTDTLVGYKAFNTNGAGLAGFLAIAGTDSAAYGVNTSGQAAIQSGLSKNAIRLYNPVGIPSTPAASAILDVSSTTKGFLLPRMTTAERDLIAAPATGLMIYNTTTSAFNYYNAGWQAIGGASGITIGSTAITSGTDYRILFQDATASDFVTQIANFTMGSVATGILDVPVGYAIAGVQIGRASTQATKWGYGAGFSTSGTYYSTFIGAYAGENATSDHLSSVGIGSFAMRYVRAGTNFGVAIGYQAGYFMDEQEVAIGHRAGYNGGATTGVGPAFGTFVGCYSGYKATASGYYNCFYGNSSGLNITSGAGNIFIGASAGAGATVATISSSAGFGREAICLQSNILVFGSLNYPYTNIYFNGEAGATVRPVTLHGSHGSGTNISGSDFGIDGGNATGTAAGGNLKWTTSVKRASGTTVQSSTDRHAIIGKYVDITAGSAQTFGNLALATSGTVAGGDVIYTIEANDATDFQAIKGTLQYVVVNKAGTLTAQFEDTQVTTGCACSAGTLTATVTAAVSGTNLLFQADAASSLSETTLRVTFQVLNNSGPAIITPN